MLALVKTPRTEMEMCISGSDAMTVIRHLRRRFTVEILDRPAAEDPEERIDANRSEYDRANRYRLLPGYRLKAGLTQKRLAELSGIRQNLISDYENGRRKLTRAAAVRFAAALNIDPERLYPAE